MICALDYASLRGNGTALVQDNMSTTTTCPAISVIVPMYNAERLIARCLTPLLEMRKRGEILEIIVVDDCATDRSADIVRNFASVILVRMETQGGPGAARNMGASIAAGAYLWFVDSDVVVAGDAGRTLRETLARTRAAAVIGSYDDQPDAGNFLSQYKNLVHHYYHHRGKENASTFWGGCGAVDRALFLRLGGSTPSDTGIHRSRTSILDTVSATPEEPSCSNRGCRVSISRSGDYSTSCTRRSFEGRFPGRASCYNARTSPTI